MRRLAAIAFLILCPLYCGAQAIESGCLGAQLQAKFERSLLRVNETPLHQDVRNDSNSSVVRLTVFGPWSELAELVVKLKVVNSTRGKIVIHRRTQVDVWNTHVERVNRVEFSKLVEEVKGAKFIRQERAFPHKFIRDGSEMVSTSPKDGETWVLEDFHEGKYRCVSLYAPIEGSLYEIGSQLLKIADKKNYAYR